MNRKIQKIYNKIADRICFDFPAGGQLPAERSLAEYYACTRTTIRNALQDLRERGFLKTRGNGNFLTDAIRTQPEDAGKKRSCNIVMLLEENKLRDANTLDYLAGVIHASAEAGANLIIREIPDNMIISNTPMLEKLHEGIPADGYLLTMFSENIKGFLEDQFKPCVVMGDSDLVNQLEKKRFTQVYLPMRDRMYQAIRTLADHGHQRILYMAGLTTDTRSIETYLHERGLQNITVDFVQVALPQDSTEVCERSVEQVLEAIRDHTGLYIPFFAATAMRIYQRLGECGYTIPQRLSVVLNSARFDYYAKVYGIDNIYASAQEEGADCIRDLVRQIKSQNLSFGYRFAGYCYRKGNSVAQAMSPAEVERFDKHLKNNK